MRLKHLESALCSVPTQKFPSPNITLEQYATSPLLTAHVIITALNNGDVGPGRSVLDLGCGTGMLTIGSALVGSDSIIAFDCDENAIEIARENVEAMEIEDYDEGDDEEDGTNGCKVEFILGRVHHCMSKQHTSERGQGRGRGGGRRGGRGPSRKKRNQQRSHFDDEEEAFHRRRGGLNDDDDDENNNEEGSSSTTSTQNKDGIPLASNCVDTVLTNPPFGTKHNAGIDVTFLKAAVRLARHSVYSFHKSSTRPYLLKCMKEDNQVQDVQVVAQMKFDIPNTYKFHNKKSVDVDVDLIRITIHPSSTDKT